MAEAHRGAARRLGPALGAAWLALAAGCGVVEERDGAPGASSPDLSRTPDAVPRAEPRSRYGNPRTYVVHGRRYHTLESSRGFKERGIASWYGTKFHGRRTSSGEPYDMYRMTAAHKSLPLPSYVEVRELTTGRRIVVRVNDRGPFHANRVIDLSYAAATKLGIADRGTGLVEITAVEPGARPPLVPVGARQVGVRTPVAPVPVRMFLQIGAFAQRANAQRLEAVVRGLVRDAVRITPATSRGLQVYRVRLGPLEGVEHADRLAGQLAQLGLGEPQVVLE